MRPDSRRKHLAHQGKTMHTFKDETLIIEKQTSKLHAFRLEDTTRAPAIILFVDSEQPKLIPIKQGQTVPTKVKSANMEAEIQIITYDEVHTFMHQGHDH
jgi:hypothetical protein